MDISVIRYDFYLPNNPRRNVIKLKIGTCLREHRGVCAKWIYVPSRTEMLPNLSWRFSSEGLLKSIGSKLLHERYVRSSLYCLLLFLLIYLYTFYLKHKMCERQTSRNWKNCTTELFSRVQSFIFKRILLLKCIYNRIRLKINEIKISMIWYEEISIFIFKRNNLIKFFMFS